MWQGRIPSVIRTSQYLLLLHVAGPHRPSAIGRKDTGQGATNTLVFFLDCAPLSLVPFDFSRSVQATLAFENCLFSRAIAASVRATGGPFDQGFLRAA